MLGLENETVAFLSTFGPQVPPLAKHILRPGDGIHVSRLGRALGVGRDEQ
jgi:hypothetical protein